MALTKLNVGNLVLNSGASIIGAGELFTTGNVYYVSSVIGNDNNAGTDPKFPLATLSQAQSSAAASSGDIVIIMPGHAETLTAALTLSKAGVSYIGTGVGSAKAQITVNGAVNGLAVTGNGINLANIHFTAPGTDLAKSMVAVSGNNAKLLNISGIASGASKTFVDGITIATGADDLYIDGIEIYTPVASAVNSFISFGAGTAARTRILNALLMGQVASAGIYANAAITQIRIENVSVAVTGTTKAAVSFPSGANSPTGLIRNSFFSGTSSTTAAVSAVGTAVVLQGVYANIKADATAQGVLQPVAQQ